MQCTQYSEYLGLTLITLFSKSSCIVTLETCDQPCCVYIWHIYTSLWSHILTPRCLQALLRPVYYVFTTCCLLFLSLQRMLLKTEMIDPSKGSWLCVSLTLPRGVTAVNGGGLGVDRPAELVKSDDEYDAFRKRMMLAYRFRPNPLVTSICYCFLPSSPMNGHVHVININTAHSCQWPALLSFPRIIHEGHITDIEGFCRFTLFKNCCNSAQVWKLELLHGGKWRVCAYRIMRLDDIREMGRVCSGLNISTI